MGRETEFEEGLSEISGAITTIKGCISLVGHYLPKNEAIPETVFDLNVISKELNKIHDFLLKYNDFFDILDKKFGTNSMKCNEASKRIIGDMKRGVHQMLIFLSKKKFKAAEEIFKDFIVNWGSLLENLSVISLLPHIIDYSKLSNKDWRMIGFAGIHYRSRVFLSYFFRDADPKKDENQQMIDYYMKPTLELLNIEPVTARGYLKPQELIDDRIIELIEDCDGIIGFYTNNDSVENVEHELSKNLNVVAICKEEEAKAPSMRLSRLLINFKRDQMGDFLIQLIKVLKSKGLFRLMI